MNKADFIKAGLIGAVLSLLIVGVVSSTLIRHVIQVTPLIVVFILAKKQWSKYAAIALFIFWFFIMSLIWLFLLGISNMASGTYSVTEIIMTITTGISCILGILFSLSTKSTSTLIIKTSAFLSFLIFQIAMMWLSLREYIAHT